MRRGIRAGRGRVPEQIRFVRTIPKKVRDATRPIYNLQGQVIFHGSDDDWKSWINNERVIPGEEFPYPYASAVAR